MCVAFKQQYVRRLRRTVPLNVQRACSRHCAAVCRSEGADVSEICQASRVVEYNGINYGFWMWKTENKNKNDNEDNKQTFRGGDGFCQGRKASLPHLYNSDFVAAAEQELKDKLGKTVQ